MIARMDLSLSLADMLQLGIVVVAVVLYLTRGRQEHATAKVSLAARLDAQGREIGDLKKRISDMAESHELVARLEERINALTTLQAQLPKIISDSVESGIRAALGAVLAGAVRDAARRAA